MNPVFIYEHFFYKDKWDGNLDLRCLACMSYHKVDTHPAKHVVVFFDTMNKRCLFCGSCEDGQDCISGIKDYVRLNMSRRYSFVMVRKYTKEKMKTFIKEAEIVLIMES